jgi:hypothetical protein
MRIGDAVAQLGITPEADLALVIVKPAKKGWLHFTLDDCAEREVRTDLYLASGLFRAGTITQTGGRTEDNLGRILWLPFDFDLSAYLGCAKEELFAEQQAVINDEIAALRLDVEEVFAQIGLPIHRLDYTGYGLAAFSYLPPHPPASVPEIRRLHKAIVARINRVAGRVLADPQVSDAGTRIMRLVPCQNTKGPIPRQSSTIYRVEGTVDETTLRAVAGDSSLQPGRVIARTGKRLGEADAAAIVAAVAPHWTLGQKHWMSLALAGMLAKAGVPEEQAEAIVDQLAVNDDRPRDRRTSVHDSYEKWRSGLQVQGFMSLRQMMPADVLAFVDGVLDKLRLATTVTVGGKRADDAATSTEEPYALTRPPAEAFFGWFGDYLDLVEPTTEAPDGFHLGSALTLAGAMIGRRVRTNYASDPLYANLYTVLIGPSGSSRKDTAIKRSLALPQLQKSIPTVITPAFAISRDISSGEGLVQVLKEQPNTLLYLTELSAMIGNARRKSTRTILDRLIEAWDTPHRLQNLNKLSPATAESPYLSIIAATQPGRLALEMTDEDIHSGFANRWLYIVGEGKDARPRPPALDEAVAWRMYLDLKRTIDMYADGTILAVSPDIQGLWDAWYVKRHGESGKNEEEDAMRVRHPTLIQKIALIYAVSEGAKEISVRHVTPALALVEWMWGNVRQLLREWGIGIYSQIERRILTVLEQHGAMKRRLVQMRCGNRKWSARDFAAVFEAMVKNGTIAVDPTGLTGINLE